MSLLTQDAAVVGTPTCGATVRQAFDLYLQKYDLTPVTDAELAQAIFEKHDDPGYPVLTDYYRRLSAAMRAFLAMDTGFAADELGLLVENRLPEELRDRVSRQLDAWQWASQLCLDNLLRSKIDFRLHYRPQMLLRPLANRIFLRPHATTALTLEELDGYAGSYPRLSSHLVTWHRSIAGSRLYGFGGLFAGEPTGRDEAAAFLAWVKDFDADRASSIPLRHLLAKVLRVYRVMLGVVSGSTEHSPVTAAEFDGALFAAFCLAPPAAGYEEVPATALLRSVYVAYLQLTYLISARGLCEVLSGDWGEVVHGMSLQAVLALQASLELSDDPQTHLTAGLDLVLPRHTTTIAKCFGPAPVAGVVLDKCVAQENNSLVAQSWAVLFGYERIALLRSVTRALMVKAPDHANVLLRPRLIDDDLSREYPEFPLQFTVSSPGTGSIAMDLCQHGATRELRQVLPWLPEQPSVVEMHCSERRLTYRMPVFFGLDSYLQITALFPCSRKTINYLLAGYGLQPNDYLAPFPPYIQQFTNLSLPSAQVAMTDQVVVRSLLHNPASTRALKLALHGVDDADVDAELLGMPSNLVDIRSYVLGEGSYDANRVSMENIFLQYHLPGVVNIPRPSQMAEHRIPPFPSILGSIMFRHI